LNQKYLVKLSESERSQLKQLVSSGTAPARELRRAKILLKSDSSTDGANWNYQAICEPFDVSNVTVSEIRRTYLAGGLETVLNRKNPDRIYEHLLDGENEAHLIVLVCSETPSGRDRGTLRLLRDRFIQLGYVENFSHETICTTIKKNKLKPWLNAEWCIPPKANGEFVCKMEDLLDVYTRLYDPKRPQVCMDETSKQRLVEV